MYAITGAFGQTGTVVCETLLAAGERLRLIVRRDDDLAAAWRSRSAEVCVVDLLDTTSLTEAFRGVSGAYLLNPPAYMAHDLFATAREVHSSLITAANNAAVPHVVALSSVGAHQAAGTGNIMTTHDFEQQLQRLKGRLSILRAANFMENWAWSLPQVLEQGVLPSMFYPPDRQLPMVSAQDIGRTAASLFIESAASNRIVELHGPQPSSPQDAAAALSELLNKNVTAVAAVEGDWPVVFRAQGFPETTVRAFCDMFRGFNDSTVVFQGGHDTRHGGTTLKQALAHVLSAHERSSGDTQSAQV
jgi:uncharacterized protein YbjT (DUF2867 family)